MMALLVRCSCIAAFVSAVVSSLSTIENEGSGDVYVFECPVEKGRFRNNDDCGSFYECLNWTSRLRSCPSGLHFSELTNECVLPELARCSCGNETQEDFFPVATKKQNDSHTATRSTDGAREPYLEIFVASTPESGGKHLKEPDGNRADTTEERNVSMLSRSGSSSGNGIEDGSVDMSLDGNDALGDTFAFINFDSSGDEGSATNAFEARQHDSSVTGIVSTLPPYSGDSLSEQNSFSSTHIDANSSIATASDSNAVINEAFTKSPHSEVNTPHSTEENLKLPSEGMEVKLVEKSESPVELNDETVGINKRDELPSSLLDSTTKSNGDRLSATDSNHREFISVSGGEAEYEWNETSVADIFSNTQVILATTGIISNKTETTSVGSLNYVERPNSTEIQGGNKMDEIGDNSMQFPKQTTPRNLSVTSEGDDSRDAPANTTEKSEMDANVGYREKDNSSSTTTDVPFSFTSKTTPSVVTDTVGNTTNINNAPEDEDKNDSSAPFDGTEPIYVLEEENTEEYYSERPENIPDKTGNDVASYAFNDNFTETPFEREETVSSRETSMALENTSVPSSASSNMPASKAIIETDTTLYQVTGSDNPNESTEKADMNSIATADAKSTVLTFQHTTSAVDLDEMLTLMKSTNENVPVDFKSVNNDLSNSRVTNNTRTSGDSVTEILEVFESNLTDTSKSEIEHEDVEATTPAQKNISTDNIRTSDNVQTTINTITPIEHGGASLVIDNELSLSENTNMPENNTASKLANIPDTEKPTSSLDGKQLPIQPGAMMKNSHAITSGVSTETASHSSEDSKFVEIHSYETTTFSRSNLVDVLTEVKPAPIGKEITFVLINDDDHLPVETYHPTTLSSVTERNSIAQIDQNVSQYNVADNNNITNDTDDITSSSHSGSMRHNIKSLLEDADYSVENATGQPGKKFPVEISQPSSTSENASTISLLFYSRGSKFSVFSHEDDRPVGSLHQNSLSSINDTTNENKTLEFSVSRDRTVDPLGTITNNLNDDNAITTSKEFTTISVTGTSELTGSDDIRTANALVNSTVTIRTESELSAFHLVTLRPEDIMSDNTSVSKEDKQPETEHENSEPTTTTKENSSREIPLRTATSTISSIDNDGDVVEYELPSDENSNFSENTTDYKQENFQVTENSTMTVRDEQQPPLPGGSTKQNPRVEISLPSSTSQKVPVTSDFERKVTSFELTHDDSPPALGRTIHSNTFSSSSEIGMTNTNKTLLESTTASSSSNNTRISTSSSITNGHRGIPNGISNVRVTNNTRTSGVSVTVSMPEILEIIGSNHTDASAPDIEHENVETTTPAEKNISKDNARTSDNAQTTISTIAPIEHDGASLVKENEMFLSENPNNPENTTDTKLANIPASEKPTSSLDGKQLPLQPGAVMMKNKHAATSGISTEATPYSSEDSELVETHSYETTTFSRNDLVNVLGEEEETSSPNSKETEEMNEETSKTSVTFIVTLSKPSTDSADELNFQGSNETTQTTTVTNKHIATQLVDGHSSLSSSNSSDLTRHDSSSKEADYSLKNSSSLSGQNFPVEISHPSPSNENTSVNSELTTNKEGTSMKIRDDITNVISSRIFHTTVVHDNHRRVIANDLNDDSIPNDTIDFEDSVTKTLKPIDQNDVRTSKTNVNYTTTVWTTPTIVIFEPTTSTIHYKTISLIEEDNVENVRPSISTDISKENGQPGVDMNSPTSDMVVDRKKPSEAPVTVSSLHEDLKTKAPHEANYMKTSTDIQDHKYISVSVDEQNTYPDQRTNWKTAETFTSDLTSKKVVVDTKNNQILKSTEIMDSADFSIKSDPVVAEHETFPEDNTRQSNSSTESRNNDSFHYKSTGFTITSKTMPSSVHDASSINNKGVISTRSSTLISGHDINRDDSSSSTPKFSDSNNNDDVMSKHTSAHASSLNVTKNTEFPNPDTITTSSADPTNGGGATNNHSSGGNSFETEKTKISPMHTEYPPKTSYDDHPSQLVSEGNAKLTLGTDFATRISQDYSSSSQSIKSYSIENTISYDPKRDYEVNSGKGTTSKHKIPSVKSTVAVEDTNTIGVDASRTSQLLDFSSTTTQNPNGNVTSATREKVIFSRAEIDGSTKMSSHETKIYTPPPSMNTVNGSNEASTSPTLVSNSVTSKEMVENSMEENTHVTDQDERPTKIKAEYAHVSSVTQTFVIETTSPHLSQLTESVSAASSTQHEKFVYKGNGQATTISNSIDTRQSSTILVASGITGTNIVNPNSIETEKDDNVSVEKISTNAPEDSSKVTVAHEIPPLSTVQSGLSGGLQPAKLDDDDSNLSLVLPETTNDPGATKKLIDNDVVSSSRRITSESSTIAEHVTEKEENYEDLDSREEDGADSSEEYGDDNSSEDSSYNIDDDGNSFPYFMGHSTASSMNLHQTSHGKAETSDSRRGISNADVTYFTTDVEVTSLNYGEHDTPIDVTPKPTTYFRRDATTHRVISSEITQSSPEISETHVNTIADVFPENDHDPINDLESGSMQDVTPESGLFVAKTIKSSISATDLEVKGTSDIGDSTEENVSEDFESSETSPEPTEVTIHVTPSGEITCSCKKCYLPMPGSCTSYYKCKKGKLRRKRCHHGKIFDHGKRKCEKRNKARCPHEGMANGCSGMNGMFADASDNRKYIRCSDGVSNVEKCPSGFIFDPDQKSCRWATPVTLSKNKSNVNEGGYPGCDGKYRLVADPTDEKCFYRCIPRKVLRGCCSGTHVFDSLRHHCVHTRSRSRNRSHHHHHHHHNHHHHKRS